MLKFKYFHLKTRVPSIYGNSSVKYPCNRRKVFHVSTGQYACSHRARETMQSLSEDTSICERQLNLLDSKDTVAPMRSGICGVGSDAFIVGLPEFETQTIGKSVLWKSGMFDCKHVRSWGRNFEPFIDFPYWELTFSSGSFCRASAVYTLCHKNVVHQTHGYNFVNS